MHNVIFWSRGTKNHIKMVQATTLDWLMRSP